MTGNGAFMAADLFRELEFSSFLEIVQFNDSFRFVYHFGTFAKVQLDKADNKQTHAYISAFRRSTESYTDLLTKRAKTVH